MSRPFPSRNFKSREPLHRRNGKIRAREVRVIDENKEQLGVMSLNDALRIAQSKGLDLIEIAATATPPVCRIVDYGKFLYEEAKRAKSTEKQTSTLKELQISPAIDVHDLATKRAHAIDFLCDEMKVRVKMRFRGRQKAHKEIGLGLMNQFVQDIAAYGKADAPPRLQGDRDLDVVLSPLPRNKRAKHPKDLERQEEASAQGTPKRDEEKEK